MGDRSVIDAFARRQHGVFNTRQIREAGYDRYGVLRRVGAGEWIRLGPSVFCLASAPATWERQLSAALLSRRRAIVGGESAAYLHRLRGARQGRPTIVVPSGANARLVIGRVIRSKHFRAMETDLVSGFAVSSVAETLFQLLRDHPLRMTAYAVEDAVLARKVTLDQLQAVVDREVGSPWAGIMQRLIVDHSADAPTPGASYLEALLERLLADEDLPPAIREFPFTMPDQHGRVDVFIPEWRLAIEADGRAWHGRLENMESDRRRDAWLASQGVQVIRLTYRMIVDAPGECLDLIRAAGAHRSAPRSA